MSIYRPVHLLTISSLLSSPLLAGCPGDETPPEKLSLASLTAAQREELVHGVIGFYPNVLAFITVLLSPTDECPRVRDSGTTRTITGGCTDKFGALWTGKVTATNATEERDPSKATTVVAEDFGFREPAPKDDGVQFDGTVTWQGMTRMSQHLTTITPSGSVIRTKLDLVRADSVQRVEPGGTIELVGAGYADIVAEWNASAPSGSIELRGLDVFRVDVSGLISDDNGDCAPASLDGTPTEQVCDF